MIKAEYPMIHVYMNNPTVMYRRTVARRAAGLLGGRGRRPVVAVSVWPIPPPS